jgi:hypothetical protein
VEYLQHLLSLGCGAAHRVAGLGEQLARQFEVLELSSRPDWRAGQGLA